MRHLKGRSLAVVLVVLVAVVAGTSAALAAGGAGSGQRTLKGHRAVAATIASELGISTQQLRSDLAGGETLAAIATANGTSAAALTQEALAALQQRLDTAVAAGKLTSSQEATRLSRASTLLGRLVNSSHPAAALLRLRLRTLVIKAAARYLGLTPAELRTQLAGGSTLTQVANLGGKTSDGLSQAVVSSVETRLARAVGNGTLSDTQEQTLVGKLQQRLAVLLG